VPLAATESAGLPVPRHGGTGRPGARRCHSLCRSGPLLLGGRPIRSDRSATGEPLTRASTSAISAGPGAWARPAVGFKRSRRFRGPVFGRGGFGHQCLRARHVRVGVKGVSTDSTKRRFGAALPGPARHLAHGGIGGTIEASHRLDVRGRQRAVVVPGRGLLPQPVLWKQSGVPIWTPGRVLWVHTDRQRTLRTQSGARGCALVLRAERSEAAATAPPAGQRQAPTRCPSRLDARRGARPSPTIRSPGGPPDKPRFNSPGP
jgi:hypothetical protein